MTYSCLERARLCALMLPVLLLGCSRPTSERICPSLEAGALAVSELRGPQQGTDTWGQWIELANTTAAPITLGALTLRLTRLDGTGEIDILVRDASLEVAAGGYAVLGRFKESELPAWAQYGYAGDPDADKDLYSDGILDVLSCGDLIDRVVYHSLPASGSLSFDGSRAPDATANDDDTLWCDDATPGPSTPDGGATQLGLPGTPGARNHPCP